MAEESIDSSVKGQKSETWRDIVCIIFAVYLTPVAFIPVWLISRWSILTRWIVTAISIIAIIILANTSYKGYKYAQFQRSYAPVLGVQQALDLYGIQNNKYPVTLAELKPKYIADIPTDKSLDYKPSTDSKDYSLKATVEGKNVELRPAFAQIPTK